MAEAFPISGNIDPKTFPFLLADLHRQGATGSLKVDGPSYPKALYFRGGRILFGSSNDPKDQLGAILIENGKISQEQLDEVNTKLGPGNPLAKVLAESGFVNQRELSESARVKVERILSDVLSYTSGSFEFEDGVLPKGAVDLKLSTEKLLVSAVARLPDRGFVLRHLDSLAVVLKPTPDMGERMAELRPDAGDLPERLDGQRTLKEAASLTRLDEFEAAKVACALLFLRLVEKTEGAAAGSADGVVLDLAEEAHIGLGDPARDVASDNLAESEPAFFVPEEGEETGGGESIDITMADTPAPRFAQSETPPLGLPITAPPSRRTVPEPEPMIMGFSLEEPAAPAPLPSVAYDEQDDPTVPRLSFDPPRTEVIERHALPPPMSQAVAAPPPPSPFVPDFSAAPPAPALAFEEEPTREAVAPARPSREDLAALDALLNPSASIRSTTSVARPRAERWEPQMRSPASSAASSRPSRRQRTFPVVPVAIGFGVLTAAGLGAWYYFGRTPKPPTNQVVAQATPRPVATVPATTLPPAVTPTPVATPDTAQTVTPSTTIPPAPVTAATSTPIPPTPLPSTPSPAATARPTPRPAANGIGGARQLLERRDYAAAARGFANAIRSSPEARYSVQLLVACSDETVEKALQNAGAPELLILPVSYKGRSCYRLCWGIYDSESRADSATRSVPAYFREGGAKPKVSATASLLP